MNFLNPSSEIKRKKYQRLSSDDKALILLLSKDGCNKSQIARFIQCSRSCVAKILVKFKKNKTIKNYFRKNYHRVLNSERVNQLINFVRKPENKYKSLRSIKVELKLPVSRSTICRILRAHGLKSRVARKVFILGDNHKLNRESYAKEYEKFDDQFWNNVIFVDEKSVQNYCNGKIYVRSPLKDNIVYSDKSRRLRINLFGYISTKGIGIFMVSKKFNGKKYISLLRDVVLPELRNLYGDNFKYLQDNASFHKSKKTLNFFKNEKLNLIPHPARSPDLNCIENFWGLLQKNINSIICEIGKQPTNENQLFTICRQAADRISNEVIRSLIGSMKKRLLCVLNANGGLTKY